MGPGRGRQNISADFLVQPELSYPGFRILLEGMFPLISGREKVICKLTGSHWSTATHSVTKLSQRSEQQSFILQFCEASKQTFFLQPPNSQALSSRSVHV